MQVRFHEDAAAFAELVMPIVHAEPARHTVLATTLAAALRPGTLVEVVLLLSVHDDDGAVLGGAMRTAGWPMITSAIPVDTAPAVVDALLRAGVELPSVGGPAENARAVATEWCARTGATSRISMAMRGFRLDTLRPPVGVPGGWRTATPDDVDLLVKWEHDFSVTHSWPVPTQAHERQARYVRIGVGIALWEVDGRPVSMAVASPPVAGMSRISGVWTPEEHRCHGFGSAATAAASRWALDAGADEVVLFTDLANPVSNSIYPKIGYRPTYDALDLVLEP